MSARLIIADDEPLARARLRAQILELGVGDVVGEAASGIDAVMLAETMQPDVILLDIRMPGMDGLEAARHLCRLPQAPAIIFTTAYNEHALAAFETHAVDYLLKPIRSERLQTALTRAVLLTTAQRRTAPTISGGKRRHFSALIKGSLRLVEVDEVRYLQADQGYVTVKHSAGELLIEDSLRALEEEFVDEFLRIHRNTLVARAHIVALERDSLGNGAVVLRDMAEKLPVSRRLLSAVRRRLRDGSSTKG